MVIAGRVVESGPPGSTGRSMAAAVDDDEVRPLADGQPSPVQLPRRDRRVDAVAAQRPVEGQRLLVGIRRGAGRPARIVAADREGDPGPRIDGFDRGVRPERHDRAAVDEAPPGVALASRRERPTAGGR